MVLLVSALVPGSLTYDLVNQFLTRCSSEHGLHYLLERDGVGVELSRQSYEAGEWAAAVEDAWMKGRDTKAKKRIDGDSERRGEEGRKLAKSVVEWVEGWWGDDFVRKRTG